MVTKKDPLSPPQRVRADRRGAADLGWLDLKREAAKLGEVEIVSALDQQMRLKHASGPEIKLWRASEFYFGVAVDGVLLGKGYGALEALDRAAGYVKKQGGGG